MNEGAFTLEVEIPDGIEPNKLRRAAELCIGCPILIDAKTHRIAAVVDHALIQPNILLLNIKIVDENLKYNFEDYGYVMKHYIEVDPFSSFLTGPH